MDKKIIVISGATASGKSNLGIELSKALNGFVVNADSMQIYDGLPVLSAQPTEEEQSEVEHTLYAYFKPNEKCSVFKWLELVKDTIYSKNKLPILVGGTGMYISRFINGIKMLPESDPKIREEANKLYDEIGWENFYKVVKEIDPESAFKLNKNDKHRTIKVYEVFKTTGKKLSYFNSLDNQKMFNNIFHINIDLERDFLYGRCEKRFKIMLDSMGGIDEVKNFIEKYPYVDKNYSIYNTIGFKQIKDYIEGKIDYETMFEESVRETRNYAKRQHTWFKNQFVSNVDYKIYDLNYKINDIVEAFKNHF